MTSGAPANPFNSTEPPPPLRSERSLPARLAIPLLLFITLIVLGRLCGAQFTGWDDYLTIRNNPTLLPPTPASVWHHWTSPSASLYIPVTYSLWALISWATQITDASGRITQVPWAFHTANLLIHLIAVVTAFRLLRLLNFAPYARFCGALLFAIHPLQVEAVAWASGMKDLLAGTLGLIAMLQYLLYAREPDPRGARAHYFWASIAFVIAVLAKPSAMTLPLTVAALDRLAVARPWRRVLPPAAAWLIFAVPMAIVARIVQDTTGSTRASWWTRPFIAADSITFYLHKFVCPLHLAVDYGHSATAALAAGNWHWNWLISVFIAIALFAGRRKRPIILLAALISLFGCLPVLGMATSTFQYTSTTADHYLYFSMFGAAMALAWFLTAYPNTATRLLAAVALAACGILSFHQAGLWMDEQALWWHNLEVNPNSFVAYSDLGMMYARIGDNARAVTAFTREVQLHPNDDSARDDLANAFHEAGRLDDAILAKRQTLDLERGSPSLYTNWARHTAELGAFLCEAGRCNEALPYLKTAHAIAPHDAKVTWLLQRAATQAASTTPPETQPPSWP